MGVAESRSRISKREILLQLTCHVLEASLHVCELGLLVPDGLLVLLAPHVLVLQPDLPLSQQDLHLFLHALQLTLQLSRAHTHDTQLIHERRSERIRKHAFTRFKIVLWLMAEWLGNRAINQKVASSIPRRAKMTCLWGKALHPTCLGGNAPVLTVSRSG